MIGTNMGKVNAAHETLTQKFKDLRKALASD